MSAAPVYLTFSPCPAPPPPPAEPDTHGYYNAFASLKGPWAPEDIFVPISSTIVLDDNGRLLTPGAQDNGTRSHYM